MDEQIKKYLVNYLADLEYQFGSGGIEYVNYNSAGTPEFQTDAAYVEYTSALRQKIRAE